jgi:hypothetical protein
VRGFGVLAGGLAAAAACFALLPSGAPAHHRPLVIRYTAQQPLCSRAQLGRTALVVGDGNRFRARCERNGEIATWDAVR